MRGESAAARAQPTSLDERAQEQRGQEEFDTTFEAFCHESFPRVERFLRSRCADRELVADAVQEAFITARAKWDQIRDFDKPLGWMYKTALNKLRVQQQRRQREVTVSLDEVPPERLAEPVDSGEAQELLQGWLQRLPPRQAEVFSMSCEGFTDIQISNVLGISYNTARAYKQEARRQLQQFAQEAGFVAPAGRGGA
jgi:RNA polymerase sigma-70 factor (ECF subfamily)